MQDPELQQDPSPTARKPRASKARSNSILRDPVVRMLAFVAAGLVVLYLITIVSALVLGVLGSPEPRTRAERDEQHYERLAMMTPEDPAVWKQYINSLIATKQYLKAQDVIDRASEVIDQSTTQDISTGQAQLYLLTGRHNEAIELCGEIKANLKKSYEAALKTPDSPEQKGEDINDNYWTCLLIEAESYAAIGDLDSAITVLDEYLEFRPTAADILVWRGDLRAEVGDIAGAEADYRAAQQFVADDPDAAAGLERIGAE